MNIAIDFNDMVLSSYVRYWPMISFIIACGGEETVESQQMIQFPQLIMLNLDIKLRTGGSLLSGCSTE